MWVTLDILNLYLDLKWSAIISLESSIYMLWILSVGPLSCCLRWGLLCSSAPIDPIRRISTVLEVSPCLLVPLDLPHTLCLSFRPDGLFLSQGILLLCSSSMLGLSSLDWFEMMGNPLFLLVLLSRLAFSNSFTLVLAFFRLLPPMELPLCLSVCKGLSLILCFHGCLLCLSLQNSYKIGFSCCCPSCLVHEVFQ
jgi:hypothetical protein